jgi:hypothetical protein
LVCGRTERGLAALTGLQAERVLYIEHEHLAISAPSRVESPVAAVQDLLDLLGPTDDLDTQVPDQVDSRMVAVLWMLRVVLLAEPAGIGDGQSMDVAVGQAVQEGVQTVGREESEDVLHGLLGKMLRATLVLGPIGVESAVEHWENDEGEGG